MSMKDPAFTFIDLFAGIGGFHAAMHAFGGECVYAVEIDNNAATIYEKNWGIDPRGDITKDATDTTMTVPKHDVLCAGFPCQPFSKSGAQLGMEETRGTLYWNILNIIEKRKPALVVLENVRNLAGPRHIHELKVIVSTLRDAGYLVTDEPIIFSPHLLPPSRGGRPQVRERVFIVAVRKPNSTKDANDQLDAPPVNNQPVDNWTKMNWDLKKHLPLLDRRRKVSESCELSQSELWWLDAWDEFVREMWELREGKRLEGFPLWGNDWEPIETLEIEEGTPKWKRNFLIKNAQFYSDHKKFIDHWTKKWDFYSDKFPPSRRKFEWQAQDTPDLWSTAIQMRPTGIRAKQLTYLPALVAITQTSIIGPYKRRLSVREAARLQGLPDWYDFGEQADSASYKQLGNGVSIGALWHVVRESVHAYKEILEKTAPDLAESVLTSKKSPDTSLKQKPSSKPMSRSAA